MFNLKDKFGELKEDAGTIKDNINKLSTMLENENKNILELQDELQNNYNLIIEKIDLSNKKEEELQQIKKELIESNIENKNLKKKLYEKEKDSDEMPKDKTNITPRHIDLELVSNDNNETIEKELKEDIIENEKIIEIENKYNSLETVKESGLTPFKKAFNENYIKNEKSIPLVKHSHDNIKEINAKILDIESDEWYIIERWAKENNVFDCGFQRKAGYFHFFDTLSEYKNSDNELTSGQMIKAREIYIALENAGYDFAASKERKKNEDVDDFFMKFVDEVGK